MDTAADIRRRGTSPSVIEPKCERTPSQPICLPQKGWPPSEAQVPG